MSRIRSTGTPARQIPGGNQVVVKSSAASMRQIRCPRCNTIAVPTIDPISGMTILVCPSGHRFSSRPL